MLSNASVQADIPMADLASFRTERSIRELAIKAKGVAVVWDDGVVSHYHAMWLRDNCPCPQCRHPRALERTYIFIDEPPPVIYSASLVNHALEVAFLANGTPHRSHYSIGWLRSHQPDNPIPARNPVHLWDARMRERMTTLTYDQFMTTPAGLRTWIEAINAQGIALIRGVPQESGALLEVAQRIGPVRESNFGKFYDVISMPKPNASAYTDMGLELHTDLVNWRFPPDVQLLSCLENSVVGGESIFADGFKVAEDLRRADPGSFEVLTSQPVEFRFHDETCDIRAAAPVIEVDRAGGPQRIRFNNWLRAATPLPLTRVEPMYHSLGRMWRMLRDPTYRLQFRLEPGDLVSYNNNRVLHGRVAFDSNTGERHLQGCYLNQEDLDSTLRLLDRLRS
jgi:gamma-butyrobetaine dioxygenase